MTSRATPRQQSGSFSIDDLKPHEKKSFSTNPVELNKSNLVGHWHYESGAKPNAQDTLVGLAMRVLSRRPAVRRVRESLDAITGKAGLVCHPERKSRDSLTKSARLGKGRNSKRCLGCARHDRTGSKPNAQDTLVGLAVHVYQGGQQFAEFANPSTLLREKLK